MMLYISFFFSTVSLRAAQFTCVSGPMLITILLTGVINVLVLTSRSASDLSLRGWHTFLTSLMLGHVLPLISVGSDFHHIYPFSKEESLLELGISKLSIDLRSGKMGIFCSIR